MNKTSAGLPTTIQPFEGQITLIPHLVDDEFHGEVYKVEQVIFRDERGGARLHLWFQPDPRMHSHPWAWIDCRVIRGSYMSHVLNPVSGEMSDVVVRPGAPTRLEGHMFHQIHTVEPGTLSLMEFGPQIGDGKGWSNIRLVNGVWKNYPTTPDSFLSALRHLNPRLRPEAWQDPYAHYPVPSVADLLKTL